MDEKRLTSDRPNELDGNPTILGHCRSSRHVKRGHFGMRMQLPFSSNGCAAVVEQLVDALHENERGVAADRAVCPTAEALTTRGPF